MVPHLSTCTVSNLFGEVDTLIGNPWKSITTSVPLYLHTYQCPQINIDKLECLISINKIKRHIHGSTIKLAMCDSYFETVNTLTEKP